MKTNIILWNIQYIYIFDKFQSYWCKNYQIVAGNVHSPPIFAANNIMESRNFVLQIENIFVRIIVSAQVELKQVQKYILLYRPQEKLNIWKMEVSSSQFINKILILENNNFTQQFQKQKRPSLVVVMLSYYTAPIHNDMTYLDYY
ncbi:Hypothetical_protein [Hexamita inflata]|uniref:Hypothetical_protein n=1 Tax=Hexamita inflata TaxID=28002 RepID=A0AA86U1G3_9EUKA|nr:Hypothetical protein HINF_LOCUS25995 [Hexamita inflata]